MAYWGYQTKANFCVWIVFAVCFVTGCIWLPLGGVSYQGCGYCWDHFAPNTPGPVLEVGTEMTPGMPGVPLDDNLKSCKGGADTFRMFHPDKSMRTGTYGQDTDARDEFWVWCQDANGAIDMIIAGSVVLGVSFLLLFWFCIAKPPGGSAATADKA